MIKIFKLSPQTVVLGSALLASVTFSQPASAQDAILEAQQTAAENAIVNEFETEVYGCFNEQTAFFSNLPTKASPIGDIRSAYYSKYWEKPCGTKFLKEVYYETDNLKGMYKLGKESRKHDRLKNSRRVTEWRASMKSVVVGEKVSTVTYSDNHFVNETVQSAVKTYGCYTRVLEVSPLADGYDFVADEGRLRAIDNNHTISENFKKCAAWGSRDYEIEFENYDYPNSDIIEAQKIIDHYRDTVWALNPYVIKYTDFVRKMNRMFAVHPGFGSYRPQYRDYDISNAMPNN